MQSFSTAMRGPLRSLPVSLLAGLKKLKETLVLLHVATGLLKQWTPKGWNFPQEPHAGGKKDLEPGVSCRELGGTRGRPCFRGREFT